MKAFTVKKGKHFSMPRAFKLWFAPINKSFTWNFQFTDSCKYELDNEDQKDWNKICGVDMGSVFSTMKYTVMGGWRYNPDSQLIELNSYIHDGKGIENRHMSPTLLTAQPGDIIRLSIQLNRDSWIVEYQNVTTQKFNRNTYYPETVKDFVFATEIQFYFGGNQCAPQDVTIYKEFVPEKKIGYTRI